MDREELLSRLRERIVSFAASHYARDAAEDLAQEVMMVLHEKYGHVDRLEDLLPLSLRIARFKLMALRRKLVRRGEYAQTPADEVPLPDPAPDPAALAERKELLDKLKRALPQLGSRCREMFRLKLEGRTFPEIQVILGASSLNTVYTWDHRCRRRLLELMGGSWEKGA